MSNVLQNFLNADREQQLLQSFLRVGFNSDGDESVEESKEAKRRHSAKKSTQHNSRGTANYIGTNRRRTAKYPAAADEDESSADKMAPRANRIEAELRAARKKAEDQHLKTIKKKKPRENFVDFYTDKDRAAAVSAGLFDIKQSLQIKQKLDRNEALQVPDEADINSIMAQGLKEMKNGNPENALHLLSKALELNSSDLNALVSRSKCYLLLGEASKALQDAENALTTEENNIRAIYQKAESLYYLGQFEQSLMFFHRGLRARPELTSFRLGVQKTQEAIENTIGGQHRRPSPLKSRARKSGENTPKSQQNSSRVAPPRTRPTKAELERRTARKLLGELWVDKEYLEKLLKHPDLVRADTKTENVSVYAREAVDFLNKRQEFWRQQRACTALPNHKNLPADALPKWF